MIAAGGIRAHRAQRGSTLIVSMVMLLVIMMLGTSSIHSTTVQEKMAGNMKERNLAFHGAEATLRGGEQVVESLVTTGQFGVAPGYYSGDASEPQDLSAETAWTTGSSGTAISYDTGISGIQASYMFTKSGEIKDERRAMNIGGYGQNHGDDAVTVVKVTARGVSPSGTSQVVLRVRYGKVF